MKYVDGFRDATRADALAACIRQEVQSTRDYRLMEFCGGHTHAIFRFGVVDFMPANIQFIHGPGCPVCVLPASRIDSAIALVEQEHLILCCYADLMRVPTNNNDSLQKAKARGSDIRMVYSPMDAIKIAEDNPHQHVVFFAIGFETTTPPTAVTIQLASTKKLDNFSVYCNHVQTPPAMMHILAGNDVDIDGILGPSHVSTIIGSDAYLDCCHQYQTPVVIAGFEPLDVMQSVLMLVRQINAGQAEVENQYTRAVHRAGNTKAQTMMAQVFEQRDVFSWRGLGALPHSAVKINDQYARFDAEKRFALKETNTSDHKACLCPAILRGINTPDQCPLFATACTPEAPKGACMVSSEGACAAYYTYGRHIHHAS